MNVMRVTRIACILLMNAVLAVGARPAGAQRPYITVLLARAEFGDTLSAAFARRARESVAAGLRRDPAVWLVPAEERMQHYLPGTDQPVPVLYLYSAAARVRGDTLVISWRGVRVETGEIVVDDRVVGRVSAADSLFAHVGATARFVPVRRRTEP